MIRFKHFIKEASDSSKQIPAVTKVVHGTHAQPISVNQIPAVTNVVHGTHAQDLPKSVKESAQVSLPSTDQEKEQSNQNYFDWLNLSENTHLHANIPDLTGFGATNHIEQKMQEQHPVSGVSTSEMGHLRDYTLSSKGINRDLIKNHINGNPGPSEHYQEMYQKIMSIIERHTLPHIKTFSGISFNPSKLGMETADGHYVVDMPAFTSSSIDKHTANSFATSSDEDEENRGVRHMLRIHVPKGHRGFYIGNDQEKSENAFEHELLLPAGLRLKIRKRPQIHFTKRYSGNPNDPFNPDVGQLHIWDAFIVPHGEDPHTWEPPSNFTSDTYNDQPKS